MLTATTAPSTSRLVLPRRGTSTCRYGSSTSVVDATASGAAMPKNIQVA
jgi:hypothetical protein